MQDSAEYEVLKQTLSTLQTAFHLDIAHAIIIPGRNKRQKSLDTARKKLNKGLGKAIDLYQKGIRRGVL